jgi:protein-disulfide isomerase
VKRGALAPVLAAVGGAVVLVIALVVATQLGHHSNKSNASNIQLDSVAAMLSGIPQHGIELGSHDAKLTMVEFADPQCPGCGDFSRNTLPTLIQDYVRTGKVRILYMGLAFLGDDSKRLLRLAQAGGLQNKLWNVVELEYENQGAEGSGYATDQFLRAIAKAVDGLDATKVLATWNTGAVVPNMDAAMAMADRTLKEIETPTILLGPTGAKPTVTIAKDQPIQVYVDAINAQLKK